MRGSDEFVPAFKRNLCLWMLAPEGGGRSAARAALTANLNEPRKWWLRCDTDDHKIALLKQHTPRLGAAVAEL
jgi:hypothetical protein